VFNFRTPVSVICVRTEADRDIDLVGAFAQEDRRPAGYTTCSGFIAREAELESKT
jgi:hypothetical protein